MSNVSNLNKISQGAKNETKNVSNMYYVNQLNKLADKNEYIDGVNIRQLGDMVQAYSGEASRFTLRVFVQDEAGRPCYYKTMKDITKAEAKNWQVVDASKGVVLRPITKTLGGYIDAFREVLKPIEREKDEAERAVRKAESDYIREMEKKARKEAAAKKREAQKQARNDYKAGKITAEELAKILIG